MASSHHVLAGFLLRDVFPDPDVLCRYLECDQLSAVNWFLEWIVLSLEGVEFHQMVKENAPTQTEMMRGFAKSSRGRMSSSDR